MAKSSEDDKPWRRLADQSSTVKQAEDAPELTELQRQLIDWYRKTCLAAGAAMLASVWAWNAKDKYHFQVFVPPRAEKLPTEVVEGWKRSMRFKEGVRSVGRRTLFGTGVAALYFGVELAACRARGGVQDGLNTALAGCVAGGYLGALVKPNRARVGVLGALGGGLLGGASGAAQQLFLPHIAQEADQAGGSGSSSGSSSSQLH